MFTKRVESLPHPHSKSKRGAFPRGGFTPNPAAVACDDPVHGGKSNAATCKLGYGVQPLEGTEKFVRISHLKACSIVLNDIHGVALRADLAAKINSSVRLVASELPGVS